LSRVIENEVFRSGCLLWLVLTISINRINKYQSTQRRQTGTKEIIATVDKFPQALFDVFNVG